MVSNKIEIEDMDNNNDYYIINLDGNDVIVAVRRPVHRGHNPHSILSVIAEDT